MNPNVPQEVRIINAISEQLFNSWPVSIIMIDLEDCIWRLNQQVMNELHLNEYVIGRRITDLLEVVCDKKNVLEDLLLQLRERDVRIIPLDINCFIRELKYNPQIQISAESETKRSIFRKRDKTKRSKKESAQHSKSRNKSFVMTSVSAL